VLGRDMKNLVEERLINTVNKVVIIQNWADLDMVSPIPKSENSLLYELGLSDKFIVQCAGNMGLAQNIENMFKAIEILREYDNIHFLFIGSGSKRQWMEDEVRDKKLHNVTILDQRPRSDQQNFLNACDIALVSLICGMNGAGVPSRMYNIMAVGKPIMAMAECNSELSMVVEEEKIGWIVPPDNPNRLAEVVLEAYTDRLKLIEMGTLARAAVLKKYLSSDLIDRYRGVIKDLINNG
jgi:glycosyltransferase involved in cell wall biosynthesis